MAEVQLRTASRRVVHVVQGWGVCTFGQTAPMCTRDTHQVSATHQPCCTQAGTRRARGGHQGPGKLPKDDPPTDPQEVFPQDRYVQRVVLQSIALGVNICMVNVHIPAGGKAVSVFGDYGRGPGQGALLIVFPLSVVPVQFCPARLRQLNVGSVSGSHRRAGAASFGASVGNQFDVQFVAAVFQHDSSHSACFRLVLVYNVHQTFIICWEFHISNVR